MGLEPLMAHIRDDAKKRATVEGVRAEMPSLPPLQRAQLLDSLPRICPALEAYKRRNGETEMRYNGIVLLEINDLKSKEEIADIKQRAATWPTTLAAMTGTSGKSVKILVRGTFSDGSLPTVQEQECPSERYVALDMGQHGLLQRRCFATTHSASRPDGTDGADRGQQQGVRPTSHHSIGRKLSSVRDALCAGREKYAPAVWDSGGRL